jgi:hypothetical protein
MDVILIDFHKNELRRRQTIIFHNTVAVHCHFCLGKREQLVEINGELKILIK